MGYLFDPFAPERPEGSFEGLGGAVSTDSKCGPWPAKIPYASSDLHPAFRPVLQRLLNRMQELGLDQFFYIVTGKRSLDRQCRAICEGGSELSDPSRGAHTAGLAVDFHAKGPLFRHKYDTGLDSKTHTIMQNHAAAEMWKALGNVIHSEFPELVWGGDWKARYRKQGFTNDQIHLGFDPYHVELKGYRSHLPERGYWTCDGGKAVQKTGTTAIAQAAVQRAVEEQPGKVAVVPALLAGLGIAWIVSRSMKKRR